MIDFGKILKRAWQILWEYRTLWIFGILLALTAGGGGNGNFNFRGSQQTRWEQAERELQSLPQFLREIVDWFQKDVLPILTHPEEHVATIITIIVIVVALAILISILLTIVRYVSQTAVIRMVDQYESEGVKVGFREGWRLGWNRRAFRLWLVDLILTLPITLLFLAILGGTSILLIALITLTGPLAVLVGVVLLFLEIIVFVLLTAFVSLLAQFCGRATVLDDLGTIASIQHGWTLFVKHWKSAVLMWLITAGLGIALAVVSVVAFFLLIPVYLLLLLPAALVAAIPGAIAFGIASLFTTTPLTWIIGLLVALPFFFTVLFSPLIFLQGLYQVYLFNLWTLTYREVKAVESASLASLSGVVTSGD